MNGLSRSSDIISLLNSKLGVAAMTICSKCGEANDDDDKFCGRCAEPLSPKPQNQAQPQYQGQPRYQPQTPPAYGQAQVKHERNSYRLIPGIVVVVLAIALLIGGISLAVSSKKADKPSAINVDSALAAAKSAFDANNKGTDYAPQQAVANGWYANDLLIITARAVNENNKAIADSQRNLSLISVICVSVLLLAFGGYAILKVVLVEQ